MIGIVWIRLNSHIETPLMSSATSTMDATTSEKHKSRHRHDSADEHRSKKRKKDKEHKKDKEREHKKDKDRESRREHKKDKRKDKSKHGISVVDDDSGEDVWVEKNIDGEGEGVSFGCISWFGGNY